MMLLLLSGISFVGGIASIINGDKISGAILINTGWTILILYKVDQIEKRVSEK